MRFTRRQLRGLAIVALGGQIRRVTDKQFEVRSQSGDSWYKVKWRRGKWICQCEDFNAGMKCKHAWSVLYALNLPNMILANSRALERKCPECGSAKIVRHGHRLNKSGAVQMLTCKKCRYTFPEKHIRGASATNAGLALVALDLHYKGVSYADISNHLWQIYGVTKPGPTIFYWVKRFEVLVKKAAASLKLEVGDKWIIDEMFVKVNGKLEYLFNLIDSKTRIQITTLLVGKRDSKMAYRVIKDAILRVDKVPKVLLSDHLGSYAVAVPKISKEIKHINKIRITARKNTNRIERLHNTIRRFERPARGVKNGKTDAFDGYSAYYNFVRPHSYFKGRSPAGKALGREDDLWVTLLNQVTDA